MSGDDHFIKPDNDMPSPDISNAKPVAWRWKYNGKWHVCEYPAPHGYPSNPLYDPATQPYDEPLRHVQNDQITISLDHYMALIRDHQKLTELELTCGVPTAQWRAFYSASYPKLWGIETNNPTAIEAGLEIIAAPCMPEHVAKNIAAAWNAKSARASGDVGGEKQP